MFLVNNKLVPESAISTAVIYAVSNGHLAVIEYLLGNGRDINNAQTIAIALMGAASNGHLAVIEYLLSNGRTICEEHISNAAVEAARNGHLPIIEHLLASNRPIAEGYFGFAVREAARKGHLDVLQVLLDSRTLGLLTRSELAISTSSSGNIVMLELILRNGPITELARNSAITQARSIDRDRIIEMLNRAAVTNDHISIDDAVVYGKMQISLEVLKQNPDDFLNFFKSIESFPKGFVLKEYPLGIDLGGITKQVFSTFFESLQEKYKGRYWSSDKFLINEVEDDNGNFYTDLAKVLSLIFEANKPRTDKILTGSLFNERFFSILKAYIQEPDQSLKLIKIADLMKESDNPYYKSLFDYILNPTDAKKTKLLENAIFNQKETKNFDEFLTKEKMNILQPLEKFIEGLSEELKAKINSSDPDILLLDIQGAEITSEKIIKILKFDKDIPQKTKDLILKKINESNENWLKLFLFSITGSKSLSNITITISPSYRDALEIHTCFNTLDLPIQSIQQMSNDDFLTYLHLAIEDSESYTIS